MVGFVPHLHELIPNPWRDRTGEQKSQKYAYETRWWVCAKKLPVGRRKRVYIPAVHAVGSGKMASLAQVAPNMSFRAEIHAGVV